MYFEDLRLNAEVLPDAAVIDREDMLAFAHRYDNVPIHTDCEYASKTRFGQIIAPGVMSFMSVWAKYLEKDFFGEELIAGMSTKITWHKPVFAGDVLTSKAVITKLTEKNEKSGIAELTIYAYNAKGELVITDITEALVKRR